MRVEDLVRYIDVCKQSFPDFDEWEVALEQCDETKCPNCASNVIFDSEQWKYIKSHAYGPHLNKEERILMIQLHY